MWKKRIGFIGLGKMGKPMAKNIIKGGFALTVYDINPDPVNELVKLGACRANSPRELGSNSDVVILMVPDSMHVEEALFGKEGALDGLKNGSIIIVMSTVDPFYIQHMAERCSVKEIRVIDCPVSGKPDEGQLTIMAGGKKETLDECMELLRTMGKNIIHCGEIPGSGEMVKVANNLVTHSTILILNEAMVLATKFGIKPDILYEVFKNSSASSMVLNTVWSSKVLKGDFTPVFELDLALKDLGLALSSSKALKIPLLVGSLVHQIYHMESVQGKGKLDPTSTVTTLEKLAGVEVRSEKGGDSTKEVCKKNTERR